MRIENPKQALEDVAGDDIHAGVFVTWHAGKMLAMASDGRCFMACELKASEDELALGKQNRGTAIRLAPAHWKLLRKADEPFVLEPEAGSAWRCRTMNGQSFPCEIVLHHRIVDGLTFILDREFNGRRTEISIAVDGKLLASLIRALALSKDSSIIITKFEATDVLRIDPGSKLAQAVVGLMPMKYSIGVVGSCETEGCKEQAWGVQENHARCKIHFENGSGGGTGQ